MTAPILIKVSIRSSVYTLTSVLSESISVGHGFIPSTCNLASHSHRLHPKIQPAFHRCLLLVAKRLVGECVWSTPALSPLMEKHLCSVWGWSLMLTTVYQVLNAIYPPREQNYQKYRVANRRIWFNAVLYPLSGKSSSHWARQPPFPQGKAKCKGLGA